MLHESQNKASKLGPKDEQRGLLCNNKALSRCSSLGFEDITITPSEISVFTNFAVSLKRIHTRLLMEGYVIENDKIHKPE